MEIVVSHTQGRVPVTVFHIKGDINVNTFEQLREQARQAHEAGAQNLLLDLSEVRYVSSAGIRAITSMFNMLRTNAPDESDEAIQKGLRHGTFKSPHLKLLNPTPSVLEVLKMAGVDMLVEVRTDADLKAAVDSF
jgi:anti-anti-sigma factor